MLHSWFICKKYNQLDYWIFWRKFYHHVSVNATIAFYHNLKPIQYWTNYRQLFRRIGISERCSLQWEWLARYFSMRQICWRMLSSFIISYRGWSLFEKYFSGKYRRKFTKDKLCQAKVSGNPSLKGRKSCLQANIPL